MDHIYVHSTNLDYRASLRKLNDLESFDYSCMYNSLLDKKFSKYEAGRLRVGGVYIHFLLGHIPISGCPWCGDKMFFCMEPVKTTTGLKDGYKDCYMQCSECRARGPVLNLHAKRDINFVKDYVLQRTSYLYGWDKELQMKYYQWYDPKVKVPKVGEEVLCVDSEGTFFVALYECREVLCKT